MCESPAATTEIYLLSSNNNREARNHLIYIFPEWSKWKRSKEGMGPISTHGAVWVVDPELDVRLSTVDSVMFCSPLCGWSAVSVSGLMVPHIIA